MSTSTVIRVDRTVTPKFPEHLGHGKSTIVHPELQRLGPAEYDLARLQRRHIADLAREHGVNHDSLWLVTQTQGPIPDHYWPHKVFRFLEAHNLLGNCLGFGDAQAIEATIDPAAFDMLFQEDRFLLWKSAHYFFGNEQPSLQIPFFYANRHLVGQGKEYEWACTGGFGYDSGGFCMTPNILIYPERK